MKYMYVFCLLFSLLSTACSNRDFSGRFYPVTEDSEKFENPHSEILEIYDVNGNIQKIDTTAVNGLRIEAVSGADQVRVLFGKRKPYSFKAVSKFIIPISFNTASSGAGNTERLSHDQINQKFDLTYRTFSNVRCKNYETMCTESCTNEESQYPTFVPKCEYGEPRVWSCTKQMCTESLNVEIDFINPATQKINYRFSGETRSQYSSPTGY